MIWHSNITITYDNKLCLKRKNKNKRTHNNNNMEPQARSMFAELGEMFGDEMPTAPARESIL